MKVILMLGVFVLFPLFAKTYDPEVVALLNKRIKACNKNDAKACNLVGYMYDESDEICEDRFKAKDYYKKSCDLGYDVACENYKLLDDMGY